MYTQMIKINQNLQENRKSDHNLEERKWHAIHEDRLATLIYVILE